MENIPNNIMGRVQTIFGVYTRSMVILSALIAGWLIEEHSINSAVIFTSVHYLCAFLGTLFVINIWKGENNLLDNTKNA